MKRTGLDNKEAWELVERSLPRFKGAGLPPLDISAVQEVTNRFVSGLWAGFGGIYELGIETACGRTNLCIVTKRVQLPAKCTSIGDQRKKDSYDVEAAFYSEGHAERLLAAGCVVPFPLHVDATRGENLTICMSLLEPSRGSKSSSSAQAVAFLSWLARLHATYWGSRADEACRAGPGGGLQKQGCYWHLDTRPEEHKSMPRSGWMGRLALAARAIDQRLKADPFQTVCHGDAKGANIMYAVDQDGSVLPQVYDFQYCGKAAATKDLAYFFNVEVFPGAPQERSLLEHYHMELSRLLAAQGDQAPSLDQLLTSYELALCDWRRFTEIGLGGWGDSAANSRVQKVLDLLDGGRSLGSEEAYIEAMQRVFPA